MKQPLDKTPYPKDPRSTPIDSSVSDGCHVYVQDSTGIIHVAPDGLHMHPKVLGGALPALYAGDLTVQGGEIIDVTNLSGTFQFDDEAGLRQVAAELRRLGLIVRASAVRFFPASGSRPVVLE